MLRRYRDNVLQQTAGGRLLVRLYYYISPSVARFIKNNESLKKPSGGICYSH
ncbi:CFI-box-CTERM domain-containing protein [Niabella hibiscisoli]|uniref:CFI-box-CTERM domain-containing protein n=1 Tax=Niabella hibiscisoli TaxID=1825928 RepID=UPI00374D3684